MLDLLCQCGRRLRTPEKNAGKRAKCPDCGKLLRIPGQASSDTHAVARSAQDTPSSGVKHLASGSGVRWGMWIGKCVLTRKLGAGGMGEVWQAHDPHLDRRVAIKVLPAGFTADEQRQKRFQREAKLAARLHHTNTVTVYQVVPSGDLTCIAMELVEGEFVSRRVCDSVPRTRAG